MNKVSEENQHLVSRRRFLHTSGLGFGGIALAHLMHNELFAETKPSLNLLPRKPHFKPRARAVIQLMQNGGPSQMDLFDPKPELNKFAGKPIGETPYKSVLDPSKIRKLRIPIKGDANGHTRTKIFPLQTGFKKYGQSGIEISDWFPHIGSCADEIAFIRSMWTSDNNHGAQVQFHSGRHFLEAVVPGRHVENQGDRDLVPQPAPAVQIAFRQGILDMAYNRM